MRYFIHGAWVSEFTAIPQLDANANSVAIESIKVEMDGWERDKDAKEPDEATDPVPA
jgi:phage tail-like protein